jgi:hypothetical protein
MHCSHWKRTFRYPKPTLAEIIDASDFDEMQGNNVNKYDILIEDDRQHDRRLNTTIQLTGWHEGTSRRSWSGEE